MENSVDKRQQFGMWLGKPAHLRKPETQGEFAKLMGVTKKTLSRWKKDPVVISITQNYKRLEAQLHLDEVIDNMIDRAKHENPSCRTFLEWLGELDKASRERPQPLGRIEVVHITDTKESVANRRKAP